MDILLDLLNIGYATLTDVLPIAGIIIGGVCGTLMLRVYSFIVGFFRRSPGTQ